QLFTHIYQLKLIPPTGNCYCFFKFQSGDYSIPYNALALRLIVLPPHFFSSQNATAAPQCLSLERNRPMPTG
ncbi:hypothetical protein, partial [Hallella sp.]|uniref:hypothetical protein n=1 Tax=Hallella sp. TaxID=2980186 RepID=UPI0030796084